MTRDRLLMLYSVLLAIAMWGFVMVRGQSVVTLDVPVTFDDVAEDLSITDGSNIKVRVSVSGHERFIEGLTSGDISVRTSMKGLERGEHVYGLKRSDIIVPAALQVTGLSPSVLHLRLERTAAKDVPVRAVITGLPAEGYTVTEIRVSPQKVKVRGLRTELNSIEIVDTEPLDIGKASRDVEAPVNLNLGQRDISASQGQVSVHVSIAREAK